MIAEPSVGVARPTNLEEMARIVTAYDQVKAVGVGHSWWQEQFCAGSDSNSADIVMTELQSTLDFINNPVNPRKWRDQEPPVDFPIQVDEKAQTVTVAAGIPQRQLLDYLSDYTYWSEPEGWTLPAFSWFIDQTIGGAVATGTHGSSFQHGSLSSQITSLRLMTANGTIVNITPEGYPHLFKAAGVSIGRLGVITDLTMKIKPQQAVTRSLADIEISQFVDELKRVEDQYNAAMAQGDEEAAKLVLAQLDEVQSLWHIGNGVLWRTSYEYLDKEPNNVMLNLPISGEINAFDGGLQVYMPEDTEDIETSNSILENAGRWARLYATTMRGFVNPGTYAARKSFISMSEAGNKRSSTMQPYDQYEVAVPFEKAGTCLQGLTKEIYGPKNLYAGFRTPALIRFIPGEEFYLSPSNGYPVMYVNIEDHLSISSGRQNSEFDEVLNYFLDECDARLHWGKAGWPTHTPCFDGAEDYPETWCDFGCAVAELDPDGKFRSASDVWRWSASRAGTPVSDFSSCCSPDGFKKSECVCEKTPIC
jgi:FAD/FMN-containing dehydrogenase